MTLTTRRVCVRGRHAALLAGALVAVVACGSGGDEAASNAGAGAGLAGAAGAGGAAAGTGGAAGTSAGKGGAAGQGVAGFPAAGAGGASAGGAAGGASAGQAGMAAAGQAGMAATGQAGTSGCAPHVCLGVECGLIPDGCGATVDCGDCGSPGMTCIKVAAPEFQNKVKNAVEQCKTDHPDYFDLTNTNPPGGGDSVAVSNPDAFDAYVVAQVNGGGATCISDPNDAQEIRVKGATDAAENYRIRVLVAANAPNGYSAYKYQSTCSPAGF